MGKMQSPGAGAQADLRPLTRLQTFAPRRHARALSSHNVPHLTTPRASAAAEQAALSRGRGAGAILRPVPYAGGACTIAAIRSYSPAACHARQRRYRIRTHDARAPTAFPLMTASGSQPLAHLPVNGLS